MPGPHCPDPHDGDIQPCDLANTQACGHHALEQPTGRHIAAAIHHGVNEILALVLGLTIDHRKQHLLDRAQQTIIQRPLRNLHGSEQHQAK